jgi:hypothetical protein
MIHCILNAASSNHSSSAMNGSPLYTIFLHKAIILGNHKVGMQIPQHLCLSLHCLELSRGSLVVNLAPNS